MRELKFKAWDKEDKIMYDYKMGWYIDMGGEIRQHPPTPPLQNFILLQYTGFKDPKGVEIYEGDIVRWYKEFDWIISGDEKIIEYTLFQVIFEYGAFWVKMIEEDYEDKNCRLVRNACENKFGDIEVPVCEVIGNIYENKELIK